MTEITEWEVKKTRRGNRVETGMSSYEKRWIDDRTAGRTAKKTMDKCMD